MGALYTVQFAALRVVFAMSLHAVSSPRSTSRRGDRSSGRQWHFELEEQ